MEATERYQSNNGFYDITFAHETNESEWTVKKIEVSRGKDGGDAPVDVAIPDSFDEKPITDINGYITTSPWVSENPAKLGLITIGRNVRKISLLELWEEEFEGLLIPKSVEDVEDLGIDSYNPSPIYFEDEKMYERYAGDEYAISARKYSEAAPTSGLLDLMVSWHYNDAGLPVSFYDELES